MTVAGAPPLMTFARAVLSRFSVAQVRQILGAPVFLLSAPRAGSTMLFEALAKHEGIWTIGGESHGVYRAFPHLHSENAQLDSSGLEERHATAETRQLLPACFLALLKDHRQQAFTSLPEHPRAVTFVEKTPRNALNLPFLLAMFPDARFIYLYRDPRENIASLIEAWRTGLASGRFVTYRHLPQWDREAWCFLLPRGWRDMVGRSLADIAAFQWAASNAAIIENLQALPPERAVTISYQDLVADPTAALERLCRFVGVAGATAEVALPLSRTSLSPPHPEKWRAHEQSIAACRPTFEPMWQRIQSFSRHPSPLSAPATFL